MINNDTFIQIPYTQNLSSNRRKNIIILANEDASKYPELLQECNKEDDKTLEIKQIECQQRLIAERLSFLELEKKRLENLLNVLQSSDSDDDDDDQST
jgi:hypothetical protein